jgi:hypothetical protein
MTNSFREDFRWEDLSPEQKEAMRALMHSRLSEPAPEQEPAVDRENSGEYCRVRLMMAVNPSTPAPVLHQLARIEHLEIQERVAENPRAHAETLALLAEHQSPVVRAAVAENANTSLAVLVRLASDENPDVRYILAENHHSPSEILAILSDDVNPYVSCRAQRTLCRLQADNLLCESNWNSAGQSAQKSSGG